MIEALKSIDSGWLVSNTATALWQMLIMLTVGFIFKNIKPALKKGKAKRLLKIKSLRHNQGLVFYELSKANAYMTIFFILIGINLVWLVSGNLLEIARQSKLVFCVLLSPMYLFEWLWISQKDFSLELARSSGKLRKFS